MKPMKPMEPMAPMKPMEGAAPWWPGDLGTPTASGAQGGLRYAFFPEARRLALERDGKVTIHDSGDRRITGVSQGGEGPGIAFAADDGPVRLEDLPPVG